MLIRAPRRKHRRELIHLRQRVRDGALGVEVRAESEKNLLAPPSATNPHSPLARAAQASGKKDDWWKEGGVTREKINAMCWMKYETGRKDIAIDKRADLVNACVVQTLKENPIR